jgi:hypothetical protein
MKKIFIFVLIAVVQSITVSTSLHSQVLIALIFGDKLNSPGIKFGLDGGVNFSSLTNISPAKIEPGFNLGLYLDLQLKRNSNWYIHTDLLLKSTMGSAGLTPYSLNNPALDTMFSDGHVTRQLGYINAQALVRYKFKNQLFLEIGPMLGVLIEATDVFYNTVNEKNDISYKNNIYKQCNWFDIGGMGGIGYQFRKGTGVNFGLRYYYGFMNIIANTYFHPGHNNSMYLYVSIPVGAGEKSKAKKAEKERQKKENKELKDKKQM